jgi:hypothetical protein
MIGDLLATICIFVISMIATGMQKILQKDMATTDMLTAWIQEIGSQPIASLNMLTGTA